MRKICNRRAGYVKSQSLEFSGCLQTMILTVIMVEGIGGCDGSHPAGLNQIQSMRMLQLGMQQLLFIGGAFDGSYSLFEKRVITRGLKSFCWDGWKVHSGNC